MRPTVKLWQISTLEHMCKRPDIQSSLCRRPFCGVPIAILPDLKWSICVVQICCEKNVFSVIYWYESSTGLDYGFIDLYFLNGSI